MGSLGRIQLHIRKRGGKMLSPKDDGNIATPTGKAASSGWSLLASAAALPHKFSRSDLGLACFASPAVVSFICTRLLSPTLQFCSSITKGTGYGELFQRKWQYLPVPFSVLLQLLQLVCLKKWNRCETAAGGGTRLPGLTGHFRAVAPKRSPKSQLPEQWGHWNPGHPLVIPLSLSTAEGNDALP